MPTKDELTTSLAIANERVAALEAQIEGAPDKEQEAVTPGEPGVYVYDEDGVRRMDEGEWRVTQLESVAEIVPLEKTEVDDQTRMTAKREVDAGAADMLNADLIRVTAERDEARQAVVRLNDRLTNAGTLHGGIDALPSVV